jgi:hypothetical protein
MINQLSSLHYNTLCAGHMVIYQLPLKKTGTLIKAAYFSNLCWYMNISGHYTEWLMVTMLVLFMTGSCKVPQWGGLQWHAVHTEFHENQLLSLLLLSVTKSGDGETAK